MTDKPRARSRARNRPTAKRSPRPASTATTRRTSPLEEALDRSAAQSAPQGSFSDLGVPAKMVAALAAQGIVTPTEVQRRTLPDGLSGRDLLGRAQTGSGKTLAFGVPLVARLVSEGRPASPGHPRALVLTPTRELAQQVADSISIVAAVGDLSVAAVYGGAAMGPQVKALSRGVDIVVATPGRLEDLMRRGSCALSRVGVFVIDEADHMADLGFLPAVTRIFEAVPRSAQRVLFSATLDRGIERVAVDHLTEPAIHSAAVGTPAAELMEHHAFTVDRADKVDVATQVARRNGRTLFFVRTKHGADRLARNFQKRGIAAGAIHGNRNQNQRARALADFTSGRTPVLVATDVAARGIHVDGVDLVVHYDPPADHKDYLHRSGRTARAGQPGVVLSLLLHEERRQHQQMHRGTASDHDSQAVHPDHPAVHDLAAGGTPLEITMVEPIRPAPTAEPKPRSTGAKGRRRPGSGQGRNGSGPSRRRPSENSGRRRHQSR